MNALTRLLIGSDKAVERRNMVWNMAGSLVYSLAGMLLGALVTRILGADMGGIFFFAFTTFGQQMFTVAYFGVRPVQVTDTAGRRTFGDYLAFRRVTAASAAAAAILYALFCTESGTARTVLLLMSLYKILDGTADCYDSEFQRQGRLYLTGKSMAFRTLLSVAVFVSAMLLTRDLTVSCVFAAASQLAGLVLFDILPLREIAGVVRERTRDGMAAIFRESRWLFLSTFADLYIFAASKYAVNRHMTNADNSYYTTLFIPTNVVNLMANFVIRPVLTSLSSAGERKDGRTFRALVIRISALILALTLLGMAAAYLLGIPALSFLVGAEAGEQLKPFRGALVLLILGGGFYAFLNLLYYVLVILKAHRSIFLIYAAVSCLAFAVSDRMVLSGGIAGAAGAYLISMAALAALFLAAALRYMRKEGLL